MIKKLVILGFASYLQIANANICTIGEELAIKGDFKSAVDVLNACLIMPETLADQKRRAFEVRAFSNWSLGYPKNAVSDYEAANLIAPPTPQNEHRELINYTMYLREVNRLVDSLEVIKRAVALEEKSGNISMPTQYHLGWTLQELGRHEEAVQAFLRGLTAQPEYAFAYFRLGLSFEALNLKEVAINYFKTTVTLINALEQEPNPNKEFDKVKLKLKEYNFLLKSKKAVEQK